MGRVVIVLLIGLVGAGLVTPAHPASAQPATPEAAECAGLAIYADQLRHLHQQVQSELRASGYTTDADGGLSVSEFPKLGAIFQTYLVGLIATNSPPWLDYWHKLRVEPNAVHTAYMMATVRLGPDDAWDLYRQASDNIRAEIVREETQLIPACPDFYPAINASDWRGTVLRLPAGEATPFPTSQ